METDDRTDVCVVIQSFRYRSLKEKKKERNGKNKYRGAPHRETPRRETAFRGAAERDFALTSDALRARISAGKARGPVASRMPIRRVRPVLNVRDDAHSNRVRKERERASLRAFDRPRVSITQAGRD